MVMSFKYSNCLKVVFDHLRFSFNASNPVLMCRISVKYQFTIQAVCAYSYVFFFRKYRGALIGACALIRTNTVIGIHRKKSFYYMQYTGIFQFTRQALKKKKKKKKKIENTNNFGTTLFLTF